MSKSLEVEIIVSIKKDVPVNIHMDDVIEAINEMEMPMRWNYISKILNELDTSVETLSPQHKELVLKYLNKMLKKFESK